MDNKILLLAIQLQQLLHEYPLNIICNIEALKNTADSLVEEIKHENILAR